MSKNKNRKGLLLKSETLRTLTGPALDQVVGGNGLTAAVSANVSNVITRVLCPTLPPTLPTTLPPTISCITGAK